MAEAHETDKCDDQDDDPRGERRLPPTLALLVAIVLPFLMPQRLSGGPRWLVPTLEAAILVGLVVADPGRIDRRSAVIRQLSIALIVVLVGGAGLATVKLVELLLPGGPTIDSAGDLLRTGALVWIYNNLAFTFLYWHVDGGGPAGRLHHQAAYPDFAFPQQLNPELAPDGWRPVFVDYLYLGFTNALAFSPTDTLPLAHWAKLAMALQSIVSVTILSLVIANAVNILS